MPCCYFVPVKDEKDDMYITNLPEMSVWYQSEFLDTVALFDIDGNHRGAFYHLMNQHICAVCRDCLTNWCDAQPNMSNTA